LSLAATRTPMELVRLSATHLGTHGSESPRLDAEVLVAHALECRRLDLYLQFERPLGDAEVDAIRELVRRRSTGEPVAYITGGKEFYGRPFKVTRDTLIPRPETEHLVENVLKWGRERGVLRILDLGTGSGCVGVTLACELLQAEVVMTDVSEAALAVAAQNAAANGVSQRVRFAAGSWWHAVTESDRFDVIVSNPPYAMSAEMAELPRDVGEFEPGSAIEGGLDGLDAYREITAGLAARHPRLVALEIDPRRCGDVLAMLSNALPGHGVAVYQDLAGRDRVATAE
jgi:release factor glutamine methyltransferase